MSSKSVSSSNFVRVGVRMLQISPNTSKHRHCARRLRMPSRHGLDTDLDRSRARYLIICSLSRHDLREDRACERHRISARILVAWPLQSAGILIRGRGGALPLIAGGAGFWCIPPGKSCKNPKSFTVPVVTISCFLAFIATIHASCLRLLCLCLPRSVFSTDSSILSLVFAVLS